MEFPFQRQVINIWGGYRMMENHIVGWLISMHDGLKAVSTGLGSRVIYRREAVDGAGLGKDFKVRCKVSWLKVQDCWKIALLLYIVLIKCFVWLYNKASLFRMLCRICTVFCQKNGVRWAPETAKLLVDFVGWGRKKWFVFLRCPRMFSSPQTSYTVAVKMLHRADVRIAWRTLCALLPWDIGAGHWKVGITNKQMASTFTRLVARQGLRKCCWEIPEHLRMMIGVWGGRFALQYYMRRGHLGNQKFGVMPGDLEASWFTAAEQLCHRWGRNLLTCCSCHKGAGFTN